MRAHTVLALSLPLVGAACGDVPNLSIPPAEPEAAATPDAAQYVPPDAAAPDARSSGDAAMDAAPPPIASTRLGPSPAMCLGGGAPQAYLLATDATLLALDPMTLSTRVLGKLACPTSVSPSGLAVSSDGNAYVAFRDGSIDELDLSTLACTATPYVPDQLALDGVGALAAGAGPSAGRLYYVGFQDEVVLAFSDVAGFRLFEAGAVGPASMPALVDLKFDASARAFALADDGTLMQLDPATGGVIGADRTGFDASVGGAGLLAWQDELLFFQGGSGNVSRYDVVAKSLTPLGAVGATLAGVGAAPCVSGEVGGTDAGAQGVDGGNGDAGLPASSPLAPGQAWIGTYACSGGVTSAALVIDSMSEGAIAGRVDLRLGDPSSAASYAVTGTYDSASRKATFAPGGFIGTQPFGVTPVGFDGFVTLSGLELSGTVASAGCGAFSMRR